MSVKEVSVREGGGECSSLVGGGGGRHNSALEERQVLWRGGMLKVRARAREQRGDIVCCFKSLSADGRVKLTV